MINNDKEKIEDKIFDLDLKDESYHNKIFVRLGSKKKRFENVDFSHTFFEGCYFRDCVFDSCNFNGCKFINSNFAGSSFPGSKFDYATFEKSIIDNDILSNNCPSYDNLILKFARSLRMNYQSLGDSESVNMAIRIELSSTKDHLYASWYSKKTYYRNKYKGWSRIKMFLSWANFKMQEFIWGNGEQPFYLLRSILILGVFMSVFDVFKNGNPNHLSDYINSAIKSPSIFLGVSKPSYYSDLYLSIITLFRLISFGLFMSILLKRFNRR